MFVFGGGFVSGSRSDAMARRWFDRLTAEGYTVVAWTTADAEYEVHLGDCNDTLGQYYLCEAGSHEVYLVDSYYHTRLQKTAEDFKAAEETS